jgi:nucleotide-binding universal stress UspA family protein
VSAHPERRLQVTSILVGYDGSPSARRALERAAELAVDGDPVAVVSAVPLLPTSPHGPVPNMEPDRLAREEALREAEALLAERQVPSRLVEGFGDAADVILEEAERNDADLVVIGSRGVRGAERLFLGSVSSKVVAHAPCDVLVVR